MIHVRKTKTQQNSIYVNEREHFDLPIIKTEKLKLCIYWLVFFFGSIQTMLFDFKAFTSELIHVVHHTVQNWKEAKK